MEDTLILDTIMSYMRLEISNHFIFKDNQIILELDNKNKIKIELKK